MSKNTLGEPVHGAGAERATPDGGRFAAFGLALVALVFLIYAKVTGFAFVNYDDPDYVTANPAVLAGWSSAGVAWAFSSLTGLHTYWHPITWLSHMTDVEWFGLHSGHHHLVNLLLHGLNTALVLLLLRQWTGRLGPALAVAAIFALHPIQVEAVAWVASRKTVLSGTFALLACLAYGRYVREPGWARYSVVIALFALGLMTKPTLVVLPLLLLFLDLWIYGRLSRCAGSGATSGTEGTLGRLVVEKLPLLALSGIVAALIWLGHRQLQLDASIEDLPFRVRLANVALAYAGYLGKAFWPADLAVFYPYDLGPSMRAAALATAALCAVTVALIGLCRRLPGVVFGWCWFLVALVPTIGFVQAGEQAMADRYMYLPLIGLACAVVELVGPLVPGRERARWAVTVGALLAVGAVAWLTWLQVGHWRNSITLMEHALRVTRGNFVAHNNLGSALLEQGQAARAIPHFEAALQILPKSADVSYNLGLAWQQRGEWDRAAEHFRQAAAKAPERVAPLVSLGQVLQQAGRGAEALAAFDAALRLQPGEPTALVHLAEARRREGDYATAIAIYERLREQRPDAVLVLNNLAWLMATAPHAAQRNGEKAVRHAKRACELTGYREAMFVGTLAAALAEAGQFAEAKVAAGRAIDLATKAGDQALARRNRQLLELYVQNRAYHETAPATTPP